MSKPVGVGVVGCGSISGEYFRLGKQFPNLKWVACADIIPEAAAARAKEYDIPRVCTAEEMLKLDEVDVIVNLTVPKAHAPLAMAALDAGKHTYLEKPLTVTRDQAKALLAKAKQKNLLVGSAPDTFLGSGLQTARKVIDDGTIGRPVAFTASLMWPGHESWHPSPEFHYEIGGGPMFDMGPYYITALMNLLGPVKRITGISSIAIPTRTITSKPKYGKVMQVQTPDHVTGCMEFHSGAVGTIVQSFATHFGVSGVIMIYGTEGTMHVPDPNKFAGSVKIRLKADEDWTEVPPVFSHDYGRSVGLADMAVAIRDGKGFRSTAQQAWAVLDLMQGFLDSSETGRQYLPIVPYERPEPLPANADFGVFH